MRFWILIKACLIVSLVGLFAVSFADSTDITKKPQVEWRLSQYWPHTHKTSLWPTLSNHFQLNHQLKQPAVQHQIQFLEHRQDYINELTENAKPYLYYIYSQTRLHNMPAEIALIPMIESDYDPFGISRTGATGLWQMMPGTASGLGLQIDWWYDGRRNIIRSTNAALKHLEYLHAYFGSWLLALAAYDSGDGTVRAAIRYNKRLHRPTDFWHLPLPTETKLYVPKLLGLAAVIANSNHYGLHLHEIANRPYFDGIKVKGQIELSKIAKLANTSINMIRKLNPAFRRWATAPTGSYWLLLPVDKASIFQQALSNIKKQQEITWTHHRVTQGDTLSKLASEYHTETYILQRINHLNNSIITIGQELLIPQSFHGKISDSSKQTERIAEDKIPGPKRIVHMVKPEENLWTIAARYNVKPAQIRYWNHLGFHQAIKPDQKITIWKKRHLTQTTYQVYVVQQGDSLSRIGDRYQTTAHAIMQLNNLQSTVLQIGEKIKIPYPNIAKKHYNGPHDRKEIMYTVRPGQSLSVIANYYHVSAQDIVAWNHLESEKYLHVGEKLKIYLY